MSLVKTGSHSQKGVVNSITKIFIHQSYITMQIKIVKHKQCKEIIIIRPDVQCPDKYVVV